jgi:hypothetical protein
MELISLVFKDILLNDTSERMISILVIGFVTLSILLLLNLIKVHKLKSKIKQLENTQK